MARRKKAFKNITRIKNAKGRRDEYWVRVQRRGKKVSNKHFYDSDYESAFAARAAAQSWRDEVLANNPKITRQEHAERKMRNNSRVTIGVQEIRRENDDGKLEIVSYRARWIPKKGGKRVSATFTVAEHGLEDAKRLAIEARASGVFEMKN